MLISIQIPTFNQERYLKDAVLSCLKQQYAPLQVIVADDASTEFDVERLVATLFQDSRLELQINNDNLGRVRNYHHTLYNHVKGSYFMNLDGDDYFTDDSFLKHAVPILEKYAPVVFEYGHNLEHVKNIINDFIIIDDDTIIIDGKKYYEYHADVNHYSHASCIFHSETAKKIGFYTQDSLSSDYNSTCKIYLHGAVVISSRNIFNWRVHGNNATFLWGETNVHKELKSIINIINYSKKFVSRKVHRKVKQTLLLKMFIRIMSIENRKPVTWKTIDYIFKSFTLRKAYFTEVAKYLVYRIK